MDVTRRFAVISEEWWPVLMPDPQATGDGWPEADVDSATYERWRAAFRAFHDAQLEIAHAAGITIDQDFRFPEWPG